MTLLTLHISRLSRLLCRLGPMLSEHANESSGSTSGILAKFPEMYEEALRNYKLTLYTMRTVPLESYVRSCFEDLEVLMNGPSADGYEKSLESVIFGYSCIIPQACIEALHKYVTDEQLLNLLDATMDYDVSLYFEHFDRFFSYRKLEFILALGKASGTRRRLLYNYVCENRYLWRNNVDFYGDTHHAVELVRLAYPSEYQYPANQLDTISRVYFEQPNLSWEGLQYSIHMESVRRRLRKVCIERKELSNDSETIAASKVLRILASFKDSGSQQLYIRIMNCTAGALTQNPTISSCGWLTYLSSVDYDLAFGSVLWSTGCLGWLISRCVNGLVTCPKCKTHAGYYILLFMDGHILRKYSQIPCSNEAQASVHMESIMEQATQWFLCRESSVFLDLLRLSQHLSDVWHSFSDAELQILAPVFNELGVDDCATLFEHPL